MNVKVKNFVDLLNGQTGMPKHNLKRKTKIKVKASMLCALVLLLLFAATGKPRYRL